MMVSYHNTMPCHNPEELNLTLHRSEVFKMRQQFFVLNNSAYPDVTLVLCYDPHFLLLLVLYISTSKRFKIISFQSQQTPLWFGMGFIQSSKL
jgi:hypothetical protein